MTTKRVSIVRPTVVAAALIAGLAVGMAGAGLGHVISTACGMGIEGG